MELREHLLQVKRYFEEEEKKYKGPDPLKVRCDFISCLERYDKATIEDIYLPFLEETLKQFVEYPIYKQDSRFIQLWLNYSSTQPNPVEVMERMHSKGLGTECAILYSSWAELLIKRGLFLNADSVYKMGLNGNVKAKPDLQKQYDEFLRDIGQKVLSGQLVCPKCGTGYKERCAENEDKVEGAAAHLDGGVAVWEWNPLKVGDKDDFKCPMAYFEDPDPTKVRMYPRDKVYPGNEDEFSLEEILAEEYERRYKEEARQKALAEAKAREEESRRTRQELNELRKIEAEKFNSISELNPPVTPKMLNLKADIDNTVANSTTYTAHMKEAMNVVQCMWSSPAPSDVRPQHLFQSDNAQSEFVPQSTAAKPTKFEIYSEDNPSQQAPKQHVPFQIYDENADQRSSNRQVPKGKIPFEIYDENAPPNQDKFLPTKQSALKPKLPFEIYDEMNTPNDKANNVNFPNQNNQPKCKFKLFSDEDNASDLPEKLESQAKLQPFFNVQDKHDDFSDVTCNTKAFEFVLPSSTPVSLHKKPLHSLQKFEGQPPTSETTRLSIILESSKDKSTNSSTSSQASACPRTPKNGPVLQSDVSTAEGSLPIPVIERRSHYRSSSLYPINLLNTIEEESQSLLTSTNPSITSDEIAVLPLNDLTYSLKESNCALLCPRDVSVNISSNSTFNSKTLKNQSAQKSCLKNPLVISPKLVIEKENLIPGMLGFPLNSLERPNSSIPARKSSQKKPLIFMDKENVGPRNHIVEQFCHSQVFKTESTNEEKIVFKAGPETSRGVGSLSKRSSASKIPLRTVNACKKESHLIFGGSLTSTENESMNIQTPKLSCPRSERSSSNVSSFFDFSSRENSKKKLSPVQLFSKRNEEEIDSVLVPKKKNFHKNCIPSNNEFTKKEETGLIGKTENMLNSLSEKPFACKKKRGRPKKCNMPGDGSSNEIIPESNKIKNKLLPKKSSVAGKKSEIIENKENFVPLCSPKALRMRRTDTIHVGDRDSKRINKSKTTNFKENELNLTDDSKSIPRKGRRKKTQTSVPENFDPFSSSVIEELLGKVGFPKDNHLSNYFVKNSNLPTGTKSMKLGDEVYSIVAEIGKGAYAKVLKANVKSNTVALKIEKPACKWEYYIAKELQSRVPPKYACAFMDISSAYIFNNGSVLETQYAKYGTLITNINLFKEKTGKSLDLGVVLHYSIELIDIVEYLHKSKIIHADLKPDNIVVRETPAHNEPQPCLLLIDFGRCIDMSLLPPNIEFNHVFKIEDNKCIEMKENRPWTYQIDLQGLASIFYCLLVSDYMKVHKKNDRWCLQKTLLRTVKRELWNPIFDSLLNVNPATDLPFNFAPMRQSLVDMMEASLNNYLQQIIIYRNAISGK